MCLVTEYTFPCHPVLHQDLGGFTQAALLLGLRSRRRPPGYWEQLELLGAELEAFVWGSWLALPDPEAPGELYYYNMVRQGGDESHVLGIQQP